MGFCVKAIPACHKPGNLSSQPKLGVRASLSLYAVGNEEPNYLNYQYE